MIDDGNEMLVHKMRFGFCAAIRFAHSPARLSASQRWRCTLLPKSDLLTCW